MQQRILAIIIATLAIVAFVVPVVAIADNGNGNGNDCLSQSDVQMIVNETVAVQLQNVTETVQNETLTQVEQVINATVTNEETRDELISAINADVATNDGVAGQSVTMTTDGVPQGNYDLFQNGTDTGDNFNVELNGGLVAGTYNVTRID